MGTIIPEETDEEVLRRKATATFAAAAEEGVLIRALTHVTLAELNVLRAAHSLSTITKAQFHTQIRQAITDGNADA